MAVVYLEQLRNERAYGMALLVPFVSSTFMSYRFQIALGTLLMLGSIVFGETDRGLWSFAKSIYQGWENTAKSLV